MNQEERRLKRQQDTKHAIIVLVVFFVVLAAVVVGAAVLLNRFLPELPKKEPVETTETTETETETQTVTPAAEEPVVDPLTVQAAEFISGMSLEDKIAQMFMITPEALTGYSSVTAAGDTTKEAYNSRPVGGIIYMQENLLGTDQTTEMLTNMQNIAKDRTNLPAFLGVDEEGGSVTRIARNSAFGVTDVGNMSDIGATGDVQNAYDAGVTIGTYLKSLGFNVDFAPVADVLTNPENTVIGTRAFSSDAQMVAGMVSSELEGLKSQGIYGAVKHFPGHGGTSGDSHDGAVTLEKTLEELTAEELIPFQAAVDAGVSFVMVGHISLPNVIGDTTPASLSQMAVTAILREQLGYQGIVITDGMNMGAITGSYTADQAAVMAVNAGVDMILMPQDYQTAYDGLLAAVRDGTIAEERINESLVRIIKVKLAME